MGSAVDERDNAVLTIATERFERRLAEECGQLRAGLRADMNDIRTELRADMDRLRTDVHGDISGLHAEMRDLRSEWRADLRVTVAETRTELLKWSFLFWVGQAAAVTGLVTLLR
jgi:hypothetical protein